MRTEVVDALRARIRDAGPITFASFMEVVLYGEHGFYADPPVGAGGDFVTSPHVHPAFGLFVARALAPMVEALGGSAIPLTEVGAGDGTLARQLLATDLGDSVIYTAAEVSRGARAALADIEGVRVVERLAAPVQVVLAHELLDNLPFRLVRDEREIRIDVDAAGTLIERPVPIDEELRALLGDAAAAGEHVVPTGALAFLEQVADVLGTGYALLIDYGTEEGAGGPVHGYRAQQLVEDLLAAPGTSDITAGVDFGGLASHARGLGLQAFPALTQHDALLALDFEAWFAEELRQQQAQLAGGQGLEAVRTWSGRSRATILVDPAALGRLRWLVLATPGLPEPPWVAEGGSNPSAKPR